MLLAGILTNLDGLILCGSCEVRSSMDRRQYFPGSLHPLALLCFYLLLSLGAGGIDKGVPFSPEHSAVTYFPYIDQL